MATTIFVGLPATTSTPPNDKPINLRAFLASAVTRRDWAEVARLAATLATSDGAESPATPQAAVLPKDGHWEYCVIGAGPSGLQMAHFLREARRNVVVFERAADPGAFFERFPRHRRLISINKRYTGHGDDEFNERHDWNSLLEADSRRRRLFSEFSGEMYPHADDLVSYMRGFAASTGLANGTIAFRTAVKRVRREKRRFALELERLDDGPTQHDLRPHDTRGPTATIAHCDVVLHAAGLSPRLPSESEWDGVDLGVHYADASVELADYLNKSVVIVGGGNAAFETARHLYTVAAKVKMLTRSDVRWAFASHYVGDVRSVNAEWVYRAARLELVAAWVFELC